MLLRTQQEVGIAEDGPVECLVGHVAKHILGELDQPGFNGLLLAFRVAAPLSEIKYYPFMAESSRTGSNMYPQSFVFSWTIFHQPVAIHKTNLSQHISIDVCIH